jgi:hypothetical protein
MNILSYLENDGGDELVFERSDETMNESGGLTSLQRAKRKYMKKYRQQEENKEKQRLFTKNYFESNKEKIYERRKERWSENPELYEAQKERNRINMQKKRDMQKANQDKV